MKNLIQFIFIILLLIAMNVNATTYTVGPGKSYIHIIDLSVLDSLKPGDSIKVYYQALHYFEKFRLNGTGTAVNPIVLIGIADGSGNKPVLDARNAISNTNQTSFSNQDRQVIKIGEFGLLLADYFVIEGFEIRNANANNQFSDNSNSPQYYSSGACAFRPESCKHISVRNCIFDSCGNSFQGGSAVLNTSITNSNPIQILVEKCHLFNNGNPANPSSDQEHQLYAFGGAGSVLTFQYNQLGNVMDAGAQIKTRSETNIIRYNWVEGGDNDMLQLIEDQRNALQRNYVYGNVFIKSTGNSNNRLVLVGWDSSPQSNGDSTWFYNNTLISKDPNGDRFFRTIDNTVHILAFNNIFYSVNSGALTFNNGPDSTIHGMNNWMNAFVSSIDSNLVSKTILGIDPGFAAFTGLPFLDTALVSNTTSDLHLTTASFCRNNGANFTLPSGHPLTNEYLENMQYKARCEDNLPDIGAFGYCMPTGINPILSNLVSLTCYPNPSNNDVSVSYNLTSATNAVLELYDFRGALIAVLVSENQSRGQHMFKIGADQLGLIQANYFVVLRTGYGTQIQKLLKIN